MSVFAGTIRDGVNKALKVAGAEIVPRWRRVQEESSLRGNPLTFDFRGRSLPYFVHRYNCGAHPKYGTERTVELAIADFWLTTVQRSETVEIGAVTPYYWPHRVPQIVDPFDPHELVTDRTSIFDISLVGRTVISLSTFEHIGTGEYGLVVEESLAPKAFLKVFEEASQFLITVPLGYNSAVDEFVSNRLPGGVELTLFNWCDKEPYWSQVPADCYGGWQYNGGRVSTLAILMPQ